MKIPFRIGSHKIYKLRARKKEGNRVHWEDIEEYDEYVRLPDIRETIDALSEDGYDAFMLLECNDKGTDCRKRWVKYVKRKPSDGGLVPKSKLITELRELKEVYETLKGIFESNKISMEDITANAVAYYQMLIEIRNVLKQLGLISEGGSKSELAELAEFINILRQLGVIQQPYYQPTLQTVHRPQTEIATETKSETPSESAPKPQEQPQEQKVVEAKAPPVEEFQKLAEQTKEEIRRKVKEKVVDSFIMCKKLGICEEGKEVTPA